MVFAVDQEGDEMVTGLVVYVGGSCGCGFGRREGDSEFV